MNQAPALPSLLLQGVRPIGFAGSNPPGPVDVLLGADGRIASLGSGLTADGATVHELEGAYLSPGWVDLHTHIYWGATDISVRARDGGLRTGVTTLIDAGSAGEANFHGFREYVAEAADEEIFALLNIGSIGLVACNRVSELIDARSIDVDRTLACIESNRDLIRGVKVRASGVILGGWGMTPVHVAKKVARVTGLPLMVHVGEAPPTIEEILAVLTPGDIVTHCFHGKRGGNLIEETRLFELACRLAREGVVMDIGHGGASFSYAVGREAVARGLLPRTVSTDLHQRSILGPVWDLALVMSKMLAIGVSLEALVPMVTSNPRLAIGEPGDQALEVGAPGRFTAFRVVDSALTLPDSNGATLTLRQRIRPILAVLQGRAHATPGNLRFADAAHAA